ncbi:uncharacterized protein LOC123557592 [Mercenaria mercenaria]|uniref:uncharacterized protein LOC123557592 n=1 Tax=Mercenaria mercenaria TaxID=6596 RepID=UPI00234F7E99|nr:uncharacterized protein LOC123557592 [Mercenaria mercenaria]
MENTKYNDQTSGSSSDNEGSGDSRESNSMRQHAADGANPELELLLSKSYSEPQITERQHMESRHAEWQQPESRHAENQHAQSRHAVSQFAESQFAVSQHVESQLAESRHPVSQHVESRHAETRHAVSQHVGSQPSVYSYSRTSPYYSYPVIDMRKAHRIGMPHFHKIRNKSTQKNDLKFEVSQMFNVKSSKIYIIEEEGRKEEVLLKTIIVILPDNVGEECYPLIVEWYESMDHIHPQILCARMPVTWKVADVKKLLAEEFSWKGLILCRNGSVLEDSISLNSCNFRNLEKVQAMKQSCHRIEFIYQPRSDISCAYCLDVDMNWSVKQAKKQFETNFHAEIQKQKSNKESTIHFCFQDRLLEDKECVGLVLRKNIKDEKISIHFGSEDSISIDLKFRAGRKTRHKLLIVSKEISTAFLRAEVSKHLGVDPKAVKLTFEDKLIDEHDNLSQVYKTKWCSGCKIAAGVKKCKKLRIKHPTEWEEVPFEMFMLEPVSVLKSKIAKRWGLKLLQISLFCRGIRMDHHQPLQYYPIKNNMEISLHLFKYRIVLKVVILKGKKRISLIIDDSHVTTVDDLLRFCAHHFSYARQRSRGIFKDHCLDRKCTLAEEGIESGDTVIISYFDQPDLLQGSLIKIFMVRKDGHIVQRIGTVSSGLLLHAPKTTEAPQTEETSLDNGHVPEGIHVCEAKEVGVSSTAARKLKLDEKRENNGEKRPLSLTDILKNKPKYLNRARRVILQKYSQAMEHLKLQRPKSEEKPSFYLEESDTENTTGGWKSPELELDEETGKKTVVSSNSGKSDTSNTEVKSKVEGLQNQSTGSADHVEGPERSTECVRGEIESDGPVNKENEVCQRVKCIENCCKKIREVQSAKEFADFEDPQRSTLQQSANQESSLKEVTMQPCHKNIGEMRDGGNRMPLNESELKSQNIDFSPENLRQKINFKEELVDKTFTKQTRFKVIERKTNDLSGCEGETSGCESSHDITYRPNITTNRQEKGTETDSSDIDHVTSSHGEDCLCGRRCLPSGKFTNCPFLLQLNLHGISVRKPRSHTVSESAVALCDLLPLYQSQRHLPLNRTYPTFEGQLDRIPKPNADIETSGITFPLLYYVAKHVGNKWKQVLRKLKVDESEIDEIEYKYSRSGLQELGLQALMLWKRGFGMAASKELLLQALLDAGLKSVVESCENVGYCTA